MRQRERKSTSERTRGERDEPRGSDRGRGHRTADHHRLQRRVGNGAVTRLVERRLRSDDREPTADATGESPRDGHELDGTGVREVVRRSGRPLDDETRRIMERGFDHDFGRVRVHDDVRAAASARAVDARAYTVGRDVVFGAGQYAPGTESGRRLLAHELTHVVQGRRDGAGRVAAHRAGDLVLGRPDDPAEREAAAAAERIADGEAAGALVGEAGEAGHNQSVRRQQLDPANRTAWSFMGPGGERMGGEEAFQRTLAAAPGSAMETTAALEAMGPPETDEERERFEALFNRLVRLTALGLMASHRATMEGKRERLLGERAAGETSDTARAIRGAAEQIQELSSLREELRGYRRDLDVVEARSLIGRRTQGTIFGWLDEIAENTEPYISPEVRRYLRDVYPRLDGMSIQRAGNAVWMMARYLSAWRERQIGGVTVALRHLYDAFPFFSELDASDVAGGDYAGDEAVVAAARESFDEVLEGIDEAIVAIGSGDIHPLDLPQAMDLAASDLSAEFDAHVERLREDREVERFWTDFGLGLAQAVAVFIPVVGPWIALGIGAVQVGMHTEEILDRLVLSGASGSPEEGMLGVSAPGAFEWSMLAVEVALTLADLRVAWRSMNQARPRFDVEPEGPRPRPDVEEPPTRPDVEEAAPSRARGTGEAAEAAGESAGREGLDQWREELTPETRAFLRRNPEVEARYAEMPPEVRRVFTHCASLCVIENIDALSRADVSRVAEMLRRLGGARALGSDVRTKLQIFFHTVGDDLDWAVRMIDTVDSVEDLNRTLIQGFRRRAVAPPGGGAVVDPNVARATPGTVAGGNRLPTVSSGRAWLRETAGGVGLVPRQIAESLRGRVFDTFDDLREAFWKAVADDPVLRTDFGEDNLARMRDGEAPFAPSAQRHGARGRFELHHVEPIEHGGPVYDLDNIVVVSPSIHHYIHDFGYLERGGILLGGG